MSSGEGIDTSVLFQHGQLDGYLSLNPNVKGGLFHLIPNLSLSIVKSSVPY